MITVPRRPAPKGRIGTRRRPPPRQSFVDRNRRRIIWAGVAAVVLVLAGLVYLSFSTPAYACATEWTPGPTPTTAPSATPRLGFVQDDMGRDHLTPVGARARYVFCPPASGQHYNAPGVAGPITPKVYGPDEKTIPQNWIHNMEHGALVLLYKCPGDACTDAGQQALKQLYASFPASPICKIPAGGIGPVITRFDDMAFPYAALVWDQVLPMQTLDADLVKAFFAQQGERTNPEPQCAEATPTAGPTGTPGPSPTTAPTDSPAPSTGLPTASPAPGAS